MRLSMNALVNGMHGKLGKNLVLRTLRGKIAASQAPRVRKSKEQTELQKGTRDRFRLATRFAKKEMADPKRKEYYRVKAAKLGLPNAYTAAITDFMRKPVIGDVDVWKQKDGRVSVQVLASKRGFDITEVVIKSNASTDVIDTKASLSKRHYFACLLDHDAPPFITILAMDKADNVVSSVVRIAD